MSEFDSLLLHYKQDCQNSGCTHCSGCGQGPRSTWTIFEGRTLCDACLLKATGAREELARELGKSSKLEKVEITATRRLQYAIGHRIYKHESKCKHLHGHNFVFFLTAKSIRDPKANDHGLDERGRILDFGVLKERFGTWLEQAWDHGMVLWEGDDEGIAAVKLLSGQKLFRLPYNPTAENLARYVLEVVGPLLLVGTGVQLVKVQVFETENGIAEASYVSE